MLLLHAYKEPKCILNKLKMFYIYSTSSSDQFNETILHFCFLITGQRSLYLHQGSCQLDYCSPVKMKSQLYVFWL